MTVAVSVEDWPSTVTGYWPDKLDRDDQVCFCRALAHGRTVYWTGRYMVTRYQCREHLPVEAVVHQAVTR
jgi:hypothetical protein